MKQVKMKHEHKGQKSEKKEIFVNYSNDVN